MHISLDGFVAGPNGEMDWIKVDQEISGHSIICRHQRQNKIKAVTYHAAIYLRSN
jgi:SHS2 domain-containing protein